MDKQTYLKRCCECRCIFVTEYHGDRKCPECKAKRLKTQRDKQNEENKKPIKDKVAPKISVMESVKVVEQYNRENGTCLTHGQYDLLVRLGKIKNPNWR